MIVNFEMFETKKVGGIENNNNPKIGDYVVCHVEFVSIITKKLNDFVLKNVGRIIDSGKYFYHIKYDNFPDYLNHPNPLPMRKDEIDFFSDDLRTAIIYSTIGKQTDKYNL